MERKPQKTSRTIIAMLVGFLVKAAIFYLLYYATQEGSDLKNIARSCIMSLIIDVIAWPIILMVEHNKEKKKLKREATL